MTNSRILEAASIAMKVRHMEVTSGEQSRSQRRCRADSPAPLEQSDDGSSSHHPRSKDRYYHSRRKAEEFIHVQDLDKLVRKRVEEVRMPYHGRLRAIAPDASNSPLSEDILENEFLKKFMISTFNCYSGQSDPVQHFRQYQDNMVIHFRNDSSCARSSTPA